MYIYVVVSVSLRLFELRLLYALCHARCGGDTLHQELVNKYTFHGQLDSMETSSPNSEEHMKKYR